jgi:squalene-hopene/tetraprenyl-beta-curcumene cyclase
LLTQQRPDGTFENLWYRDYTSGTAVVVGALSRIGHAQHEVVQRSVRWLCDTQLPDGSWGTGTGSEDASTAATGSVEETGWAVQGLLAVGDAAGARAAIDRGVAWLLAAAQPDGSWQPTRVCNYIRHHMLYPNGVITQAVALRALGEYRAAAERAAAVPGAAGR